MRIKKVRKKKAEVTGPDWPTIKVDRYKMNNLQHELIDMAKTMDRISAYLMTMAGNIPGGSQLGVPGTKPGKRS